MFRIEKNSVILFPFKSSKDQVTNISNFDSFLYVYESWSLVMNDKHVILIMNKSTPKIFVTNKNEAVDKYS